MAEADKRRREAEIVRLKGLIDECVLRLRDLCIFIYAKVISEKDLKAFTKTYAEINHEIDSIEYKIFKLQQKVK